MQGEKCALCKNPPEMEYAVDPERPKPLCGACFGRWSPKELDALLGVTPPYSYEPIKAIGGEIIF